MRKGPSSDRRMSIGDHLDELRRRLIYSLIGIGVCAAGSLIIGRQIIHILCLPLQKGLAAKGLDPQLIVTSVPEGFTVYLKVSLVCGFVIAAPWVLSQSWKFVSVGLYTAEKKVAHILAPFSMLMMLLGIAFMYYVMLPIVVWFFISFITNYPPTGNLDPSGIEKLLNSQPEVQVGVPSDGPTSEPETSNQIEIRTTDPDDPQDGHLWIKTPEAQLRMRIGDQTYGLDLRPVKSAGAPMLNMLPKVSEYIGFITILTLGIVVAYQLPVVMLILAWTGLVDPKWLSRYRRHCVFACFVLGMLLTPSDPFSMIALALPMWGLFELGLLLMKLTYKPPQGDELVQNDG